MQIDVYANWTLTSPDMQIKSINVASRVSLLCHIATWSMRKKKIIWNICSVILHNFGSFIWGLLCVIFTFTIVIIMCINNYI